MSPEQAEKVLRFRCESLNASDSVMCGSWGRRSVGMGVGVSSRGVSSAAVVSTGSSFLDRFDLSDEDLLAFRTSVLSESAGWFTNKSSFWRCVALSRMLFSPVIQPGSWSRRVRKLLRAS